MTHITTHLGKITVASHRATESETLDLRHAVACFGFLLTSIQPIGMEKEFSFAQFGNIIKEHCSTSEPRTTALITTLENLHSRNS